MNFARSEHERGLRNQVAEFAERELNQGLPERDRDGAFSRDGWKKCGLMGLPGLVVPKDYGGAGHDPLTAAFILEGLGYGCRDNGLTFAIGAHLWGCVNPIVTSGTEDQRSLYLPRLCSGEWVGALAMTERKAGSDAYSLETCAEKKGDRYVLNGRKLFVTNGPIADLALVFAALDRSRGAFGLTAFLVERGAPGLHQSPAIEKMGLRTAMMGELLLEDCEVPAEWRLGPEGAGLAIFADAMEWERSFILAPAVGALERQLEACVAYAKRRQQFGKPIGDYQLVADKVVQMRLRLETAKLMLYKVGWMKREKKSIPLEASMAKLYISESWVQSCQDALQLHGGYGYLTEEGFERELRDAIGSRIYSGTSEIQRTIIAKHVGL